MDAELKELHNELLDITADVIKKCDENNIKYYLAWGTCLGAVRHHDIIPWDDDVDVYIDYKDYFKLKDAYKDNKTFFYQDLDIEPEYFSAWAKLRKNNTTSMDVDYQEMNMHWGICIDLFPLVEYNKPYIDKITKLRILLIDIVARLPYNKKKGQGLVHKLEKLFYNIIGEKGRKKLYFSILNSIERKGDYILDMSDKTQDMILKKEVYGDGVPMQFNNMTAKVPTDYDTYLKKAYGDDYMEIPPIDSDKRYYHDSSIIDCHKDYTEYKKNI